MMKRYKKRKKKKLPEKIIVIPNKDKEGWQEKWYKGRSLCDFPHSWRCVIAGSVSTGKTNVAKNLILKQETKPFEKIIIVHLDPETKDYDEFNDITMLTEIPSPTDAIYDRKVKKVIILDDLEYKFMSKNQLRNLDRLFGSVSSHKNTSCIVISQDVYNLPPCIRRMSNLWILGKINNDLSSFYTIAQRAGMKKEHLVFIYDKYINSMYDKLWIDRTPNTPAEYRINCYNVIDKKFNFEEKKNP